MVYNYSRPVSRSIYSSCDLPKWQKQVALQEDCIKSYIAAEVQLLLGRIESFTEIHTSKRLPRPSASDQVCSAAKADGPKGSLAAASYRIGCCTRNAVSSPPATLPDNRVLHAGATTTFSDLAPRFFRALTTTIGS